MEPTEVTAEFLAEKFSGAVDHYYSGLRDESEAACHQIVVFDPGNSSALHLLGLLFFHKEAFDYSLGLMSKAAKVSPHFAMVFCNIALVMKTAGQIEQAEIFWRISTILEPDNATFQGNFGAAIEETGRANEGLVISRRAVYLSPEAALGQNNLAVVLKTLGFIREAAECNRKAIIIQPDHIQSYANLGNIEEQQNRLESGIRNCRRAITINPDFADARANLAMALLANGNFVDGWQEFEWRWQTHDMRRAKRNYAVPQWHGEAGDGRKILIYAEQGLGDCIHFCRYVPIVAAMGWQVIVEVPPLLGRLLKTLEGAYQVILQGEALPDFDSFCPMMSLPLVTGIGTSLETIPANIPYLGVERNASEIWNDRLEELEEGERKPRIGLVWAGNPSLAKEYYMPHRHNARDRRRSLPPDYLLPLLRCRNISFFSLQKGGPPAPPEFTMINYMDEINDFADTAALVDNLDLVIAVDTSVLHLAAAIGKPVWFLDRFDSCWRWLRDRDDSPWYPAMRIFRQVEPGDWHGVIERVRIAIDERFSINLQPDADYSIVRQHAVSPRREGWFSSLIKKVMGHQQNIPYPHFSKGGDSLQKEEFPL